MTRFQAIIHFLTLGLAYAKADPADKEAIAALKKQKQDLQRQLDEAKQTAAQAPTADEAAQIDSLLEKFSVEVTPVQPKPEAPAPPVVGGESDSSAPLPNGNGGEVSVPPVGGTDPTNAAPPSTEPPPEATGTEEVSGDTLPPPPPANNQPPLAE